MKTLLKMICLLAAARITSAAPATNALVSTIDVSVGGISIKMPAPEAEFVEVGSDNRDLMRLFVPTQNRLVCGYVLTNELIHLIKRDADLQLDRYILVEVPLRGEQLDISADDFAQMISEAKETFGDKSGTGFGLTFDEANDEIKRRLKSLDVEDSISLGKPVQLGTLFSMKDACSFAMILPVNINNKTVKMGGGLMLLRAKSHILYIYVYSEYTGDETIKYLGRLTEKWARQILDSNTDKRDAAGLHGGLPN